MIDAKKIFFILNLYQPFCKLSLNSFEPTKIINHLLIKYMNHSKLERSLLLTFIEVIPSINIINHFVMNYINHSLWNISIIFSSSYLYMNQLYVMARWSFRNSNMIHLDSWIVHIYDKIPFHESQNDSRHQSWDWN